jgi:hypothetical protein
MEPARLTGLSNRVAATKLSIVCGWPQKGPGTGSKVLYGAVLTVVALSVGGGLLTACGSTGKSSGSVKSTVEAVNGKTPPCGRSTVVGEAVIRHCGPASASIAIGPSTIALNGGECQRDTNSLVVGIGVQVVDVDRHELERRYDGFNLVVGGTGTGTNDRPAPSDSSYPIASMNLVLSGRRYIVSGGTVSLRSNRTSGSFNASVESAFTSSTPNAPITGSFAC